VKLVARRHRIITGLLWAGAILSAAGAAAQTEPIPVVPPPELTAPRADPAQRAGRQPPATVRAPYAQPIQPWEYGLALGVGWQKNVTFTSIDVPSDYTGVLGAGLARHFRSPRGEVTLRGRSTGYLYDSLDQFNRVEAAASLEGDWRLSPRTRASLIARFGYNHSDSSRVLDDQGVFLPLVRTYTYSAAAGIAQQLGRRSTLRLEARALRVDFDSDSFVNGDSLRVSAGLDRRLGSRDTLGLVYSIERARGRRDIDTHFGSLRWTRSWRSTALLLQGGASFTDQAAAAELERSWRFFGGVSLNRQVRRLSLTAFYRRELIPAFGFSTVRLVDRVGLRARLPFGRRWGARLSGIYVADAPEQTSPSRIRSTQVAASLGGALARWFGVSFVARYRRRLGSDSNPPVEGYAAGVFLTVGNNGRDGGLPGGGSGGL
jgi:hypothetical protein